VAAALDRRAAAAGAYEMDPQIPTSCAGRADDCALPTRVRLSHVREPSFGRLIPRREPATERHNLIPVGGGDRPLERVATFLRGDTAIIRLYGGGFIRVVSAGRFPYDGGDSIGRPRKCRCGLQITDGPWFLSDVARRVNDSVRCLGGGHREQATGARRSSHHPRRVDQEKRPGLLARDAGDAVHL